MLFIDTAAPEVVEKPGDNSLSKLKTLYTQAKELSESEVRYMVLFFQMKMVSSSCFSFLIHARKIYLHSHQWKDIFIGLALILGRGSDKSNLICTILKTVLICF